MKKNYIKSPLNYVGGKYKLLPQIEPLFPMDIETFIDLFGGGGNVVVNANAKKYIYNDISTQVTNILESFYAIDEKVLLSKIKENIKKYALTKENKEGFLEFRKQWNVDKNNWIDLYTLMCYSFNHQLRFNSKGEFNMPFGTNRSSFNPSLEQKFLEFVNRIKSLNIYFNNDDFRKLKIDRISSNDFVYIDPPYLNSDAVYNENNGWTNQDEQDLLELLDDLDKRDIKFALSNNFNINTELERKVNKYNIIYLDHSYSNSNYQKKDKSKDIEVLITNY